MSVTISGYTGWTGSTLEDLSGWATLNDPYFSGLYIDVTGIEGRLFEIELDLLGKVDIDTTYTDFAQQQAAFRNQMNARIAAVEDNIKDIKSALISIRRTLISHNTRITALE